MLSIKQSPFLHIPVILLLQEVLEHPHSALELTCLLTFLMYSWREQWTTRAPLSQQRFCRCMQRSSRLLTQHQLSLSLLP